MLQRIAQRPRVRHTGLGVLPPIPEGLFHALHLPFAIPIRFEGSCQVATAVIAESKIDCASHLESLKYFATERASSNLALSIFAYCRFLYRRSSGSKAPRSSRWNQASSACRSYPILRFRPAGSFACRKLRVLYKAAKLISQSNISRRLSRQRTRRTWT